LKELKTLLINSISKQFSADVPVGVLLSGGLDSSIITAIASQIAPNIRTFSISFDGYSGFDETPHAKLVSDYFNTDHTKFNVDSTSSDLLPILAAQFDEPIVDSSILPTFLLSKMVSKHCKVALGGDGSDEIFGGYQHHSRILKLQKLSSILPIHLRRLISFASNYFLPIGFSSRNYLRSLSCDLAKDVPLLANYFDMASRKQLLNLDFNYTFTPDTSQFSPSSGSKSLLDRTLRNDFYNYLPEDILVKVDRASMFSSLEIRAPFLDHKIIEFGFSKVPDMYKVSGHHRKVLLKLLGAQLLPPNFDYARKQGFCLPLSAWLKSGSYRNLFKEALSSHDSIFDRRYVSHLWHLQDRGFNVSERLFALVQFELWRKSYSVNF
jgi:asparagine synthase (glutamine-hydrolysing)